MNPLELADRLREDYRRFTWTTYPVADERLRQQLEHMVDEQALLWRGPYLSVQPRFQLDATLAELGARIGLPAEMSDAFPRVEHLFTHQVEAISLIWAGGNALVATGTGSGKSEAFLVPVAAHAYANKHRPGLKAIALYPMNALVNDQEDRVKDVCSRLGLTYGVYTGNTAQSDRAHLQEFPPDILLTNYSMLEKLLTRTADRQLFRHGELRHLVLDEVHTYQGALGTEIASLVRRLRGHTNAELVCVGLSATVSAGGDHQADLRRTAEFASSLFASPFTTASIIEETAVPQPEPDPQSVGAGPDPEQLRAALADGGDTGRLRTLLGDPEASPVLNLLRAHLATPSTVEELVRILAELPQRAEVDAEALHDEVAGWLLLGADTHTPAGPPVLEAKVHLFLRGLPSPVRCTGDSGHLLLDGAMTCNKDGCGARSTTPIGVCLGCGQDYDLERDQPGGLVVRYLARQLWTEDPFSVPRVGDQNWYPARRCTRCGLDAAGASCLGCGDPTREVFVAVPKDQGRPLTTCPVCAYSRSSGAVQEFNARTAAAVTATAFSLHTGLAAQSDDPMLRRLLIFADSRQDTAFQAGYLRDRARAVQVRRLIVEAVTARADGGDAPASFNGLVEDVFRRGQESGLYTNPRGRDARRRVLRVCEWDVLGEIASDERRPPTLERLGLLTVGYPGLDDLSEEELKPLLDLLGPHPDSARWLLARTLDLARTRKAVAHELLSSRLDAKTEAELLEAGATMARGQAVAGFGDRTTAPAGTAPIALSAKGSVGRLVKTAFPLVNDSSTVERAVRQAVRLLEEHELLKKVQVGSGRSQISLLQVTAQALEIRPAAETLYRCRACKAVQPAPSPRHRCATFNCKGLMEPWHGDEDDHERLLATADTSLVVKAEEHSGQVPLKQREEIEERFKDGDLNLLVCTMTLELGVDLGQLLAVILRNVPPRPSNYAQRAGRAGRREERVALVVTFAGGLPHDSYYYARPVEMIRGAIRPPSFLLDNERVLKRHARSMALELCGEDLPTWMQQLVSPDQDGALQGVAEVSSALSGQADRIAERIRSSFRTGLGEDDLPWLDLAWATGVVENWIPDLDTAVAAYRDRQKSLLEEWQQATSTPGNRDASRAVSSIQASLDAMRHTDYTRAYVLNYLSSVGFLPSYAFPTDTTTLALERETAELAQDSVQALKDYAPGQLVYARGTKWLVDQVDFRRANLVNAEGTGSLAHINLCAACDTVNDPTTTHCLSCNSDDLHPQLSVPMRAMRATRRQHISADEEQRARAPFEVTHHLGAPNTTETWLFERPGLVLNWERGADLTILNRGRLAKDNRDSERFIICTGCGLWFDAYPSSKPTQAQRNRATLHDKICSQHSLQYSVLQLDRRVDCLQILPDLEDLGITPEKLEEFLASIRAALDLGCRITLQAGDEEVAGFDWPRPDPESEDTSMRLAVLYEEVPGGAGYLRQLAERFGDVAKSLLSVLDDCSCERSCYACLRSYGNQLEGDLLDRHVAADFLRRFVDAPDVEGRRVPSYSDVFIGRPRSAIERRLAISLMATGVPKGQAQYSWGDRGSTDGVPRPVTVADFAWPEHRLAVFCDGWEHHHTPERRAADKRKRDAMRDAGWTVLSYWGGQIVRDADKCTSEIKQYLTRE